jgi:transposase-like protein
MGERRQFSPQFKAERVLELLNGTHPPAEICRTHGIKPSLLLAWRRRLVEQAAKLFERESDRDPAQARIGELERLVGRLTLELDVAKKASNLWRTPRLGSGRW